MGRLKTNRALAEGVLKTIQRLEDDPNVDPEEPAFIQLKCNVVKRLLSLELDTAEIQSSIHLVEKSFPQFDLSEEEVEAIGIPRSAKQCV
jgi:hypothetical protein